MATRMGNVKFKVTMILMIIIMLMIVPMKVFANEEDISNDGVKIGDVNKDNKIDTGDLLLILRHIYAEQTGKKQEWILNGDKFLAGDITGNGKIDSSDTIAILRYFAASGNVEIANRHPEWLEMREGLELNKSKLEMSVGATETLTIKNLKDEKVTWTTSNDNVATVDNGKVTAKGVGDATITAKTETGREARCIVSVKAIEITNIKLDKNTLELEVGKTAKLVVTIEPSNATNKNVTWTTSNDKVATISAGTITAKGEGEATIIAQTDNGKKAMCVVKVKPAEILATSVKLDKTSLELEKGKTGKLTATIEPSNVTNKTITWTTSNDKVATVSGGTVTAKGTGEATITAKTSNGKTSSCKIKVTDSSEVIIKDESGDGYTKTVTVGSKKFKVFNQGLYGGNIPSAGCSISSEAIVLSGYGKDQTPYTISQYVSYYPRSIADIGDDLEHYGVKSTSRVNYGAGSSVKTKAVEEIENNLKQGRPVIILVRANYDSKYTRGAHYMALVGYKNGKAVIADPNGGRVWNDDTVDTLVNRYMYTGSDYEEGYVLANQ